MTAEQLVQRLQQYDRDAEVSIFDLMQMVREHPDYVFGTIFVRGDLNDDDSPALDEEAIIAELSPKHAEDRLAEIGNQMIDDARTSVEGRP